MAFISFYSFFFQDKPPTMRYTTHRDVVQYVVISRWANCSEKFRITKGEKRHNV